MMLRAYAYASLRCLLQVTVALALACSLQVSAATDYQHTDPANAAAEQLQLQRRRLFGWRRPPPPPPPPPVKYTRIKSGRECKSSDKDMGNQRNEHACAWKCKSTPGCRFFIYGKSWPRKGKCYWEKTSSIGCPEGWQRKPYYDFWALESIPTTRRPTNRPTKWPTKKPTPRPTKRPTPPPVVKLLPTNLPTPVPSFASEPTALPTKLPTVERAKPTCVGGQVFYQYATWCPALCSGYQSSLCWDLDRNSAGSCQCKRGYVFDDSPTVMKCLKCPAVVGVGTCKEDMCSKVDAQPCSATPNRMDCTCPKGESQQTSAAPPWRYSCVNPCAGPDLDARVNKDFGMANCVAMQKAIGGMCDNAQLGTLYCPHVCGFCNGTSTPSSS